MASSHVAGDDGRIELVSTRIALDGRSTTCDGCDCTIEPGARYKVAAVHRGSRIVDQRFCTEDCFSDYRTGGEAAD